VMPGLLSGDVLLVAPERLVDDAALLDASLDTAADLGLSLGCPCLRLGLGRERLRLPRGAGDLSLVSPLRFF
jgi:hypothetical protein